MSKRKSEFSAILKNIVNIFEVLQSIGLKGIVSHTSLELNSKTLSKINNVLGTLFILGTLYLCYTLPIIAYLSASKGIEIKGLGTIIAAAIAGAFSLITVLTNVESSIRNLREKWLDQARIEISDYIACCRKYVLNVGKYTELYRNKTLASKTVEVAIEEDDEQQLESSIKKLEEIETSLNEEKRLVDSSRHDFFKNYSKINIRFRNNKEDVEGGLHEILNDHFKKYSEMCGYAMQAPGKHSAQISEEIKGKDSHIADSFSSYFKDEWERIKRGEEDITGKKNVIAIALVSIILSYGIYLTAFKPKDANVPAIKGEVEKEVESRPQVTVKWV